MAGIAGGVLWMSPARAGLQRRTSPNVVFILADDMGYGDMRCNNAECKVPTPNLDRLAAQGMRFTDAHSPSAVCSPTRYAILTGRYCWRSRLKAGVLGPFDPPLIEEGRLTLPSLLKQHGYATACIGKWHLGWDWPTTNGERPARDGANVDWSQAIGGGPLAVGFDYYFGDGVPNYPPYVYTENDRTLGIPSAVKPDSMFGNPGVMLPGWDLEAVLPEITRRAAAYIEQADGPFFLYFPLTAPHTPIAPTAEFRGKTEAGAYGDWVAEADWSVGQILDAVEQSGKADDTLVIFVSDNGSPARDGTDMSGPLRSVERYGHVPNAPFRGIKSNIWDGGHRGPCIVAWPGEIPAGAVSDEPICHVDFMRTVGAIVGAAPPDDAGEDSFDLLPVLGGEEFDGPARGPIVHHSSSGSFAIRDGRWKLILCPSSGGWLAESDDDAPAVQLYDMSSDPAEERNLCTERQDKIDELTAKLTAIVERGRSTPGPAQPQVEPIRYTPVGTPAKDDTGLFDIVRNCEVSKHAEGFVLQSAGIGYALQRLDEPLAEDRTFTFGYESLAEGGSRNALFVFGAEAKADGLVKCGTLIVAGKHAIWHGPWDAHADGATAEHSLGPTDRVDVEVTLSVESREVTMSVGDTTLTAPWPADVRDVRYVGWLVNGTKTLIVPAD